MLLEKIEVENVKRLEAINDPFLEDEHVLPIRFVPLQWEASAGYKGPGTRLHCLLESINLLEPENVNCLVQTNKLYQPTSPHRSIAPPPPATP